MRQTFPTAPTSFGALCALLLTTGLTAILTAGGNQRAAPTFTPLGEGPAIAKQVMPVYPAIAQSARVQGVVIVDFTVDVSGRVKDLRILRSIPLLDQAVMEAVRQWQFMPPETQTTIRATTNFQLNDSSHYPRPSRFVQPLPSWVPDNFAFIYKYECRRTRVEIDSIDHVVRNPKATGKVAPTMSFDFLFEGDVVADAFTALDRASVFEATGDKAVAWREVPRVTFERRGNEFFVTISADAPIVDVTTVAQVSFFGGAESFSHVLAVRQGDRWNEVSWIEPVDKRDERGKAFSAVGKRIRALVRDSLVPAAAAPVCL